MKTMNLPVGRSPAVPSTPGWYVCWSGATTPRLLWWGAQSDTWREVCRAVPVDTFAGPIPLREVKP